MKQLSKEECDVLADRVQNPCSVQCFNKHQCGFDLQCCAKKQACKDYETYKKKIADMGLNEVAKALEEMDSMKELLDYAKREYALAVENLSDILKQFRSRSQTG